MNKWQKLIGTALLFASLAGSAAANVTSFAPPEYLSWLEELKADMLSRGISRQTLDTVFIQDFYHFVPGKLRIGFMPVAVAGQLMAAPVDFLYGIPVGLDHSARHKKGRFNVHGI